MNETHIAKQASAEVTTRQAATPKSGFVDAATFDRIFDRIVDARRAVGHGVCGT